MGKYLLFKSVFLVLNSIDVSKFVLMSMFKLLRSERFLKNLAGDGFTIVTPLLINSISFQVKEFISTPEKTECI